MNNQPNHSISNASDPQDSTTTDTVTGEEIHPEPNEYVVPAYDSTKNCSYFLSSILTDDDNSIQILLAMLSQIDSHFPGKVNPPISENKNIFSKTLLRATKKQF